MKTRDSVPPDPITEFFRKANLNPAREGCPGEKVLRAMAANKLPDTDPARLHLASCSPCFSEYLAFKESLQHRKLFSRKLLPQAAAAACLFLAGVIGISLLSINKQRHSGSAHLAQSVDKTVDLSNYGTLRGGGEANRLDAVSLPSAKVSVTVVLPKFSDPGQYSISVSPDRDSKRVLASGAAAALGSDGRRTVTVVLDLRFVKAGPYFLATTHNQDESSYFYPLQVN